MAGGRLWTSRGIYRLPGRDLVEYKYHVCKRCGGFRHGVGDVEPACPHCGESQTSAARTLTIPEFGFVADREPKKPGPRPPQRSWSGAVHVLAAPPEARARRSRSRGPTRAGVGPARSAHRRRRRPGRRGLLALRLVRPRRRTSSPPSKPPKHNHLLRNQPCAGPQRLLDLAHVYETDLLTIDITAAGLQGTQAAWKSVLYAVVEAACEVLEIARDDLGGSLSPSAPTMVHRPLRHRLGGCRARHPRRGEPRAGARGARPGRVSYLRLRAGDLLLRLPPQLQQPARPRRPVARGSRSGAPAALGQQGRHQPAMDAPGGGRRAGEPAGSLAWGVPGCDGRGTRAPGALGCRSVRQRPRWASRAVVAFRSHSAGPTSCWSPTSGSMTMPQPELRAEGWKVVPPGAALDRALTG